MGCGATRFSVCKTGHQQACNFYSFWYFLKKIWGKNDVQKKGNDVFGK